MNQAFKDLIRHAEFREDAAWTRIRRAANETIVREGEESSEIYLILRGQVRVVADVELDGHRHVRPGFFELGEGEMFGEMALFDRGPRSASVVAVSECELARMHRDVLLPFLDGHPELGYWFLREMLLAMAGRFRETNRKLLALFAWGLKAHGIDEHL